MITLEGDNFNLYIMDGQVSTIVHDKKKRTAKVNYTNGDVVTYTEVQQIIFK